MLLLRSIVEVCRRLRVEGAAWLLSRPLHEQLTAPAQYAMNSNGSDVAALHLQDEHYGSHNVEEDEGGDEDEDEAASGSGPLELPDDFVDDYKDSEVDSEAGHPGWHIWTTWDGMYVCTFGICQSLGRDELTYDKAESVTEQVQCMASLFVP